jgi:hypothetical protein
MQDSGVIWLRLLGRNNYMMAYFDGACNKQLDPLMHFTLFLQMEIIAVGYPHAHIAALDINIDHTKIA